MSSEFRVLKSFAFPKDPLDKFQSMMQKKEYQFSYAVYGSIDELEPADAALLLRARETTKNAYAPYSHFHVAAVAKLVNDTRKPPPTFASIW